MCSSDLFCGNYIPDFVRSCRVCGLHIREIDFEQHAVNKLNESMEELVRGFSDYLESNVFNDVIPIENRDDELMELEYFFNDNMIDYDFDEFLAFYNSCNEDLSIEEIKDLFVDDKLNNSLGAMTLAAMPTASRSISSRIRHRRILGWVCM